MSAASDFLGGATPKVWVSGTTYAAGKVVWSPTDYQYFMRKSAGGGTTDPASDTTNWQPTGDRAIKSIQRGVITGDNGATATVSSVVTAKSELRFLGFSTSGADISQALRKIVLTNSTTITMSNSGASGATSAVSWELTERY